MPLPGWFWRRLYDREARWWVRRRDEPEHRPLIEAIVERLAAVVEAPGPIADLGCGPGAHARALAARGYEVTGLDVSPKMVEAARERAASDATTLTFQVADAAERLPFADGSLGGVLSILLIQHLDDPAAFVREVARCLRPGGYMFLLGPARDVACLTTPTLYWRVRALVARTPGVVHFFDDATLAALVESAGLTVVDTPAVPSNATVLARR
jgi:SAM-dependent methyltransferase